METRISVEPVGEVERDIKVEVPRALYDERFNGQLSRAVSTVQLKGFRPGRAPRAMVAKMYGERIHGELVSEFAEDAIRKAIKDHSLKIIGTPTLRIDEDAAAEGVEKPKDADLKLGIRVDLMPEPNISDYKGLSLEVEVAEFEESKVDEFLADLQMRLADVKTLEAGDAVEDADIFGVNYIGTCEGEELAALTKNTDKEEYLSEKDKDLKALIYAEVKKLSVGGAKLGEADITVSIPEDFEIERLRGKDAQLKLTTKNIYRQTPAPLDDAMAEKVGEKDLASLRAAITERLTKEVVRNNRAKKEEKLLDAIIEKNEFAVPDTIIDGEIRMMLIQFGVLKPTRENATSSDVSRFRDMFREQALLRAKRGIVVDRLMEQEGLEASEEIIQSWIEDNSVHSEEEKEELREKLNKPEDRERIEFTAVRSEMLRQLIEASKISEVPMKTDGAEAPEKGSSEKAEKPKARKSKKDASDSE